MEIAKLSDKKFNTIKGRHGTFRGHLKNIPKLLRRVNEGLAEEDKVTEEDLKIYIRFCPECQKMSEKGRLETGYFPMLDTVDPNVNYVDILELGGGTDLHILVVFNAMTRKSFWEIIKSDKVLDVAEGIILINSRQVKLMEMVWKSDRQAAFTSDEIQNLLSGLGMDIKFGIAASHQGQSPVERSFREVRRHIVPIIAELADTYRGNYLMIAVAIAFDILNNIESVVGFSPNEAYSPLFYNPRVRQYLAEGVGPGSGQEILEKVAEIQGGILEKIKEKQIEIWEKRAPGEERPTNPAEVGAGMYVLLIPEKYDKHEFRKSGAWEVMDVSQRDDTGQTYVKLKDPIDQVSDFSVHISRVVPYLHDERHGDIKATRGKDLKETLVIRIEDHTCIGDEKKMVDYDFQILWANGIRSWLPYREASKLWMFEAYIRDHEEFERVVRQRNERRKKKDVTPPTSPQQRRSAHQVIQYIPGRPMEAPGHNSVPIEPEIIDLSADEIVEKIVSKFQLEGEKLKELKSWFENLIKVVKGGAYQNVFKPIRPGEYIKTEKVRLRMDPDQEYRSPPPYQIRDPRAREAYLTYVKRLIMEGRARELPKGSEVPINNPPRMVIDYYLEDGSVKWRFTQDARWRNHVTIKKPFFSRQTVSEILQRMGEDIKGVCDIKSAFYQLELDEESRIWTRWLCPVTGNVYEMIVLEMGGCNSPSELQDRMDKIFGLIAPYMDDLMNSHNTVEDHKEWIITIFDLCLEYNIKLAPDKCNFFRKDVEALGRLVDGNIHTLNKETKEKISKAIKPKTVTELQSFIGMENWARDYIFHKGKFASDMTKPLTEMINENPPKLNWSPEREESFELLKEAVANSLKLHFFDPSRPIHIASDASKKGWGGIAFYLKEDGTKEIFAVASGSFNEVEQKWSTNEHEAKAIHNTFMAFKNYLLGRNFILFTDNRNLTFLHNNKAEKVHRWVCDLAQFSFLAYHIPGKLNWETDFLSRILTEQNEPEAARFFDGHL